MAIEIRKPSWLQVPPFMRGGPASRVARWAWLEPAYPPVVFDLDPRAVAMVRLGRRKKEQFLASFGVEEVPPDVIEMDLSRARLASQERFRALVSGIIEKDPIKFNRVSVLIPDSYARVALLPFDEMPRSRRDALDLIKWKTKKSVPFKVEDAAVDYQVLPGQGAGLTVLAVLTPRTIVEEFENVFASVGVHAGLVALSTFALIDLYRPVFEKEAAGPEVEFLLANVSATFFSFVIFRAGSVVFFRSKAFAAGVGDDGDEGALRLLRRELQTSLVYYREKLEGRGLSRAYLRVVDHDPSAVAAIFAGEAGAGGVAWIDPGRVVSVNGRVSGEQGARMLQRLAPAIGAAAGRAAS